MAFSEQELLDFLNQHGMAYKYLSHPAVYTCAEAAEHRPAVGGAASTKNLFLRDEKKRFYLVMTDCAKHVDLKTLGRQIGAPKPQLGSPEKLWEMLGITPGAVTVLALINDPQQSVKLVVDADVWRAEHFLCHPLVNTATLVLAKASLERFFDLTHHPPVVTKIPERA
jgi:Ala-tRNA(Pro) deacylase